MKNNIRYFAFLFMSITFISCNKNNGTSTGNPLVSLNVTGAPQAATASFKYFKKTIWDWLMIQKAFAFTPPPTIFDNTNSSVSLTDFWINIAEIELKYDETAQPNEVDGDSIDFAGPYTINLFSNSPSTIAFSAVQQNSIRRIKYKTKNIIEISNGVPIDMLNFNLYLKGSVNSNNFIFKTSEQLTFETAGSRLVTLDAGDHLLLQIQTAELIRKINLSTITNNTTISESNKILLTNPCPLIDASSTDLYTCFIKGIQQQTKVGKDDGDFVFSGNEETIN